MKRLRLAPCLLASALLAPDAQAWIKVAPAFDEEPFVASTFYGLLLTLGPVLTTAELSNALSEADDTERKLIQAREDAAAFVASDGDLRGAHLEAALEALHRRLGHPRHSDMQLARGILAYPP